MFLTANSDQPLSIFWVLNSSVVNTFLRSSKISYRNLNLHYLYFGKCTLPIRIWVYVSEIGVYTYRVPSTRYRCPSCICTWNLLLSDSDWKRFKYRFQDRCGPRLFRFLRRERKHHINIHFFARGAPPPLGHPPLEGHFPLKGGPRGAEPP